MTPHPRELPSPRRGQRLTAELAAASGKAPTLRHDPPAGDNGRSGRRLREQSWENLQLSLREGSGLVIPVLAVGFASCGMTATDHAVPRVCRSSNRTIITNAHPI